MTKDEFEMRRTALGVSDKVQFNKEFPALARLPGGPNSALVTDAGGRRSRAFFSAAQRGR
jgi:hypothetical protein